MCWCVSIFLCIPVLVVWLICCCCVFFGASVFGSIGLVAMVVVCESVCVITRACVTLFVIHSEVFMFR